MLKPLIATALPLLLLTSAVQAERFQVPETTLSFDAPEGFAQLDRALIEAKFPNRNAPTWVVGNARGTTTIACGLRPSSLAPAQLEPALTGMGDVIARITPGHQWVERKLIDLAGTRWIHFEMTSTAADTDIHNIMLITSYETRMLACNFNATVKDFAKLETALRASIETMRFED